MSRFMKLPKPSVNVDTPSVDESVLSDIRSSDKIYLKRASFIGIILSLTLIIVTFWFTFSYEKARTYSYSSSAYNYAGGMNRYVKHTVYPMNQFNAVAYTPQVIYPYNKNYSSSLSAPIAFCYEAEYFFITVEIDDNYWQYFMDCRSDNYCYIDIPFQYIDISIYGILGASENGAGYTWDILSDLWYADLTPAEVYNNYRNIHVGSDAEPVRVKIFDNGEYNPQIMDYNLSFPDFDWDTWLGSIPDYLMSLRFKFAYKLTGFTFPIGSFTSTLFSPVLSQYDVINVSSFDFAGSLSSISYGLDRIGDPPSPPDPENYTLDIGFVAAYFKWIVDEVFYLFKVVAVFVKEVFV